MEQEKIDFYKGLAIYILPEGVTNYFDVVDFNEQPAKDHGKLYKTELHIYLDEKDNRPEGFDGVKSNGFGEEDDIRLPCSQPQDDTSCASSALAYS